MPLNDIDQIKNNIRRRIFIMELIYPYIEERSINIANKEEFLRYYLYY